jgi:hypothetical protein
MFNQSPFLYGTFATGAAPFATILWNTSYNYIPNQQAEEIFSTEYYYNSALGATGATGP